MHLQTMWAGLVSALTLFLALTRVPTSGGDLLLPWTATFQPMEGSISRDERSWGVAFSVPPSFIVAVGFPYKICSLPFNLQSHLRADWFKGFNRSHHYLSLAGKEELTVGWYIHLSTPVVNALNCHISANRSLLNSNWKSELIKASE